ncbi:hypothetical protein F4779DRAFT_631487 [Xylariaceae sp. FL0662B]|nr:hypothetical protein F4779DRAFT_631487 [Xylariaceae sp. FL0662B]
MTKVQKSNPDGGPSRSDSFLRMLELEKRYKMQRIHGHSPAASISTPPSTSSPSAPSDPPFRARRASGHPPLSHQTQIMKAVRRSSALPSLSISIPPSSVETPATRADSVLEEPKPKKEEATKTVTFSDPNEEEDDLDLSDQSSICQSPSWEQYGRKKKKKDKKQDVGHDKKGKEEKPAGTVKKKGNRLSKAPQQSVQGVQQLATTDRSRSAPELDLYPRPDKASVMPLRSTPPDTMATQQNGRNYPTQDPNGKPKNRGFLSGFRLHHGNAPAVQKFIGSRTSIDDTQKSQLAAPGGDLGFPNSRRPPSIRSFVSSSNRSISSLDQLPPGAPRSSGSSHGRSQSLLSSTLNKLRGPSYLYYKAPETANDIQAQRPNSSREPDTGSNKLMDRSSGRPSDKRTEHARTQSISSPEPTEQAPQFTFPPKPKRVTTQLTPGVATRPHKNHPRTVELENENKLDLLELTSSRTRRPQVPPPRAPGRELAIEKDKRSQKPKQLVEDAGKVSNAMTGPAQEDRAVEHKRDGTRQTHAHLRPQIEVWAEPNNALGAEASVREDISSDDNSQIDILDTKAASHQEDDQVSIDTHASTIRPHSRNQDRTPPENNARSITPNLPHSPNKIGRAVTSDAVDRYVKSPVAEPTEAKEQAPVEPPPRAERSADYFSFITESYAPPSLELRSPMEGRFPSPRIDEEPEESPEDMLRHFSADRHPNETATLSGKLKQAPVSNVNVTARSSKDKQPKDSPSMSSHHSDSDVPTFERLGISPKAAKILAGVETSSTSTSQSQTEPSRTTSERSSSSTYDDAPPSPSTTPDSSRPQSRKGFAAPQVDAVKGTTIIQNLNSDERVPHKSYRALLVEPLLKSAPQPTSRDGKSQNRKIGPKDPHDRSDFTLNRPDGLTSGPPMVLTPTSVTFADDVKDDIEIEQLADKSPYKRPIPPRAQSALELHSTHFVPALKHQSPLSNRMKAGASSVSLPNTPPAESTEEPHRKSALKMPRNGSSNNEEPSALIATGAAYLQEARKAAPVPPTSSSRALRPHYAQKNSATSVRGAVLAEGRAEPLAKMLVECCSCKFFHDMPSRVYECMAKPDSVIEDKLLGVSAAITTMVKCPWCGHGMTTQCCSGYAAVVYLKEKLHGK